jgi:Carboxypeptidase regulatory-like domain/TonB-dependent Receptor Plug Domain/TonB dependent receptor
MFIKNQKNMISFVMMAIMFAFTAIMPVSAQTDSARLQGTVTDSSGAIVAGATVTATNTGTNRSVKTQTNDSGDFNFLSLSPGQYRVEISQTNFKMSRQEVTLEVAQVGNLAITLTAGDVSAVVEVTNDSPLVETATSSIGQVVQGKQIVELPLNGRNVLELARLTPGVTQGVIGGDASGVKGNTETYRGNNVGGGAISVNGQRTQANNFLLDGVDNNESLVNTINIFPSADAVQEFKVQTSVATAEFGRGGGAIINTVTRSGANKFSGSAYTFVRNDNLDARPSFDATKSEFRRGQYGGTFGGPIIKDKTFFFGSFEGLRQFLPRGEETATVPTLAFRNGDFSQLLNPASSGITNGNGTPRIIQLIDPLTQTPIAGNIIPAGRLNVAALAYLRAFPLPNNGTRSLNNYKVVRVETSSQDVVDMRFDHNVNEANQLFGRVNYGKYEQSVSSRLPALPAGFGSGSNPVRTKGIVIGLNTSLSPTLFNELRIQANRIKYSFEPPLGDKSVSKDLGIVNANRNASLGGGALIGGYNGQLEYTGDFGAFRVPQTTYQIVDSMALVKGNHTLKFGGSIVKRNVNLFRPIAGKGYFRIYGNGDFDQCPGAAGAPSQALSGNTNFEQANLLIGFMCSYAVGNQQGFVGTRNWENSIFAQDDWKVNNKLTVNLGLRYELMTNPTEQYGRQSNFDLTSGRLVLAKDNKDSLTKNDKNNFSPRVGFAYDIKGTGKSVIRGGYGIFYFLDRGGIDNQLAQNAPYGGNLSYSFNDGYRFTFSGQGPLNNNNNTAATQPLPSPTFVTSSAFLNNPINTDLLAILPDNKTSNVQQFNFQFQQQLSNNTAITVGYVGTRGRNLSLYYNLNGRSVATSEAVPCPISGRSLGNCYPGLQRISVRDDNGRSQYDALQIQLTRRFTKGWQYVAIYAYSKTKDNGEGAFDKAGDNFINFIEPYAASRLDFPHVFSFQTSYELPFGRGKQFGGEIPKALDYLIGGWSINTIYRLQSGSPFDVRKDGVRVNLVGNAYTDNKNKTPYLNRAAFVASATGFGSLERNSLRSPSTSQLNFGISKNFAIYDTMKLQFRMDAFNLTNSIQWGTPNTDLNNGNTIDGFGTIRGSSPFSNRQIQFGLRLAF